MTIFLMSCASLYKNGATFTERNFNGVYRGRNLNRVAFPLGGIGAGMICLEGTGAISHVSVRNRMDFFNEPCMFAALCVKGKENIARVLEGPIPDRKYFGAPGSGSGSGGTSYGFPRFRECEFLARFPFAYINLKDEDIPIDVSITGWSPFIPGDADNSSLPVSALEYCFKNTARRTIEAVFSFNSENFMAVGKGESTTLPIKNGFILWEKGSVDNPENEGGFAIFVKDMETTIDYCWFKGRWFDALTLVWRNIEEGILMDNPPVDGYSPGASLFVPFRLAPGEEKTITLMFAWHVPKTDIRLGDCIDPAFAYGPSRGTARQQQPVTGFLGKGFVNTFDPYGDAQIGVLTSPAFTIEKKYIHFLIAGGDYTGKTCINLLIEGQVQHTATGSCDEHLVWKTWDVFERAGKEAVIQIIDHSIGAWGHINIDHIILSDKSIEELQQGERRNNSIVTSDDDIVFEDFEGGSYRDWKVEGPEPNDGSEKNNEILEDKYFVPWYAGRFANIEETLKYWRNNYDKLRRESALFRDTFYDTNLPVEVMEAVAANLTILKSPTVLRQTDGRLWAYEGCGDNFGSCHGSCTHVWNYAQAIPHLFPKLERTLRETEFFQCQNEKGHQQFRACLPIRKAAHGFHAAADGQLGGIMKVHREWRISGDNEWLRALWPNIKQSLEYCIATWDPDEKGILEEPHHNTYDIEYWGPEGHCTSFYLGALTAAIRMGEAMGEDAERYKELLKKGKAYMERNLFNGEYFYQRVTTEGLRAKFEPLSTKNNDKGYKDVVKMINAQGPKYQYGMGCLSDGVLGFWLAKMCGLGEDIVDPKKVRSHLKAVHKYNLKQNLSAHANPQRPSFAMSNDGGLLLCSWPTGRKPALPFVYSDEVWTGVEYQVASHLIMEDKVEEGLEIVRICRKRYDGTRRNPFNEYECGHWYARALSSYGLVQALTGVRYDAIDKTLYIDSKIGDFRSFLATETGFGTVGLKNNIPFVEVKHKSIDIERVIVSDKKYGPDHVYFNCCQ